MAAGVRVGHLIDGRYRLLDQLGSGGMSVVWHAYDDVLERDVAIKVLSPELAFDPELMQRIRLEARSAARLRHPNVVEVHDFGEMRDDAGLPHPYVVMELVDGRSLAQMLTGDTLPWRLAVLICAQVAAALAAAHGRGIVHRDVKPGNVMVTAAGVKLVDFGISATVGEVDASDGQVLGTPAYLAPERLDGGPVRPATDVYALGLLLYRVLADRLPWQASTTTQMLAAHRYEDPAELPPIEDLPGEVSELCHRCLSKQPADRPTAAEVARILGDVAGLAPALLLLATAGIGRDADDPPSHDMVSTLTSASSPVRRTAESARAESARAGHAPVGPRRAGSRPARMVAAGAGTLVLSGSLVAGWGVWSRSGAPPPPAGAVQAGPVQPTVECTVRYAVRRAVDNRSATAVTIVNTGSAPVADWQLTFAMPADQRLLRGWVGVWTQDGRLLRARGDDLPPGGSVATGFDATYQDVNALPAGFELNGSPCRSLLSVVGRSEPPVVPVGETRAATIGTRRTGNAATGTSGSGSGSGTSGSGTSGSGTSGSGTSGNGTSGSGTSGSDGPSTGHATGGASATGGTNSGGQSNGGKARDKRGKKDKAPKSKGKKRG